MAALAGLVALPLYAQGPGHSNGFSAVVTGLDAYAVDHSGSYPYHQNPGDTRYNYYMPNVLTTPMSYLQPHQITDPFATGAKYNRYGYFNTSAFSSSWNYQSLLDAHGEWGAWSIGPARINIPDTADVTNLPRYDATNGTMSAGVMFRSQRMLKETGAH